MQTLDEMTTDTSMIKHCRCSAILWSHRSKYWNTVFYIHKYQLNI